jgi:hypothetical protein
VERLVARLSQYATYSQLWPVRVDLLTFGVDRCHNPTTMIVITKNLYWHHMVKKTNFIQYGGFSDFCGQSRIDFIQHSVEQSDSWWDFGSLPNQLQQCI